MPLQNAQPDYPPNVPTGRRRDRESNAPSNFTLEGAHDQPAASLSAAASCAADATWQGTRSRRVFLDRLVRRETPLAMTGTARPACWQEPSARPGVQRAVATRSFLSTA